jgi:hypothetical protein
MVGHGVHVIDALGLATPGRGTTYPAVEADPHTRGLTLKRTYHQFGAVEEIEADPVEVRKTVVNKRTQIRRVGNAVVFTINQCPCLR